MEFAQARLEDSVDQSWTLELCAAGLRVLEEVARRRAAAPPTCFDRS